MSLERKINIVGLEKYRLSENDLKGKHQNTIISWTLYFKNYQDRLQLIDLTPKERGKLICLQLRNDFKKVIKEIASSDWEIIGTKFKPRGLKGQITPRRLFDLKTIELIDRFFIEQIEGIDEIKEEKTEKFYSVIGLFAAFIEGYDYLNTTQMTEERFLLVKAIDSDDAEKKAMIEFEKYTQDEYLNDDYRYVNWKLIEIQDIYETDTDKIDPNGTEIYSIWKRRKLKTAGNSKLLGRVYVLR
jgi:hypothetical protein